jgi:uncharacterized protein (TIGR00156 family)
MRKSLYILPAVMLFGVTTAGAQIGKDTESEQRNRPETQKPQNPSSSQQSAPQQPSAPASSKGSPQPMGSDTEAEQRNRPEKSSSNDGNQKQSGSSSKSGAEITTASGVASGKDDQKVQLRGKIVSKQGGNEYMFQDSSGQVLVEIGSKALKGSNKQLAAGTEVEIQGEVDTRKGKAAKVEANSVTVVASASGASGSSSSSR